MLEDAKDHVVLAQDKTDVSTNDGHWCAWLKCDQQPLKKEGNGQGIHVADWICEITGQLALSPELVEAQLLIPDHSHL